MANDNEFVKQRLDELQDESFQPNSAHARVRLRGRETPRAGRWVWSVAATAVVAAIMMTAMPSARAVALETGDALESLHHALLRFHNVIYEYYVAWVGGPPQRMVAADFQLAEANGKTVRLSDYRGKVVLLNFWATWCAPCKTEVPFFVDLQKRYASDLVVLGVSLDEDGWKSVKPFMGTHKVNYPVMLASPELPAAYREIEQLPATLLIDRQGRIIDQFGVLNNPRGFEDWLKERL